MQNLKLKSELMSLVINKTKHITIRSGYRPITLGPLLLIDADDSNFSIEVTVYEVKHTYLGFITNAEAQADGFKDAIDLVFGLQKFYSGINMGSEITVVRWQ